jgi:uncharacterized protein YgbK (DUF1537 family)
MASPPPLVVLADDLTGAADCAAYAPGVGLPAAIVLHPPPALLPDGLTAVALDLRALPPAEVRGQVAGAVARLGGRRQTPHWFLKVDSLLRGSVGAGIEAALAALDAPVAVLCPALPVMGRGVVGGRLVGGTKPPLDIAAHLAQQTALPTASIPLQVVRRGGEALADALRAAVAGGARVLLPDAMADLGLDNIAAALEAVLPDALPAGSAGLAAAWLRRRALPATHAIAPPALPGDGRVLAVVGSASVMAARQVAATAAAGSKIARAEVDPGKGAPPRWPAGAWGLALHLPPTEAAAPLHRAPAEALADAAFALIQREGVRRLVVTGGHTARALLDRLEIARLEVLYEAAPGMPGTTGCAGPGAPAAPSGSGLYTVVLKAGSHGDERTLAHLMRTLHLRRSAAGECA